jgi:sorbitol-specific phosphotransferase system component IIC
MNFWIFLVGFAIVISGVAWGLSVAGVATTYILITCVILLGLGILTAVTRTRQKDPPA